MAKRVDPLKAKQAKQKKMAIGLCVVFAAVLAYQGPKTMKMLQGPQAPAPVAAAAAAPTSTSTTPVDPIPVPGAPPVTGVVAAGTPAAAAAQPAVLIDSDIPAAAGNGQLSSFELFEAKDPFAQQGGGVETVPGSTPAPAPGAPAPDGSKPTPGGAVIAPAAEAGAAPSSPPPAAPPAAPVAAPASATSISVNGVAADVALDATFPVAAPAFVLVSAAKDGKSVQIGVAGGVYADGSKTIKLTVGKPLTLRNTADGSEYVLLLKSVAGVVPPKQK